MVEMLSSSLWAKAGGFLPFVMLLKFFEFSILVAILIPEHLFSFRHYADLTPCLSLSINKASRIVAATKIVSLMAKIPVQSSSHYLCIDEWGSRWFSQNYFQDAATHSGHLENETKTSRKMSINWWWLHRNSIRAKFLLLHSTPSSGISQELFL